jgi:hypothetical protein
MQQLNLSSTFKTLVAVNPFASIGAFGLKTSCLKILV